MAESKDDTTTSRICSRVMDKFKSREQEGLVKYGTTMDRNDLSLTEWLNHLQEELMDATLYIEKLKQEVQYQEYDLTDETWLGFPSDEIQDKPRDSVEVQWTVLSLAGGITPVYQAMMTAALEQQQKPCLLYTSPSPRDS